MLVRTFYSGSSDFHILLCKYYDLVNWFYKEKTLSICRAWFNCFVFPCFLTLYHYSVVTTASLMTIIPQPRSKAHHQSKYNLWTHAIHWCGIDLGTSITPSVADSVQLLFQTILMMWTCSELVWQKIQSAAPEGHFFFTIYTS